MLEFEYKRLHFLTKFFIALEVKYQPKLRKKLSLKF